MKGGSSTYLQLQTVLQSSGLHLQCAEQPQCLCYPVQIHPPCLLPLSFKSPKKVFHLDKSKKRSKGKDKAGASVKPEHHGKDPSSDPATPVDASQESLVLGACLLAHKWRYSHPGTVLGDEDFCQGITYLKVPVQGASTSPCFYIGVAQVRLGELCFLHLCSVMLLRCFFTFFVCDVVHT